MKTLKKTLLLALLCLLFSLAAGAEAALAVDDPIPDESTAVNMLMFPNVDVEFTISRKSTGESYSITNQNSIDTSRINGFSSHGDVYINGYTFELSISGPERGRYALNPNRAYYYDLDLGGAQLFIPDPVERDAEGYAVLKDISEVYITQEDGSFTKMETGGYARSTQLKVVRNPDGSYRFMLYNPSEIITYASLTGYLGGPGSPATYAIYKSDGLWDISKLAYRFTIVGILPRALVNYEHYYFLEDKNHAYNAENGAETANYSGFVQNAFDSNGNFLLNALKVTIDGQVIPPLSAATEADTYAYYLEKDTGRLYFFNKTDPDKHYGSHPINHLSDLKEGWCLCWQSHENLDFSVEYDDVYGRQFVVNNRYENYAYLCNEEYASRPGTTAQKAIGTASGQGQNRSESELLDMRYEPGDHTFTIIFNMSGGEVGTVDDVESLLLYDEIENATIKSGTMPLVSWKPITGNDEQVLVAGNGTNQYYMSVADNRKSFQVTIHSPQAGLYYVRCEVELIDPNNEEMSSTVSAGFAGQLFNGIKKTITPKYSVDGGGESSQSNFFTVHLVKHYEGSNPLKGATFSLYECSSVSCEEDLLIAESKVDLGSPAVRLIDYIPEPGWEWLDFDDNRPVPYNEGDDFDIINFDYRYIEQDKVYYIVEKEAPEGYEENDARVYFMVTKESSEQVVIPDGNYNKQDVWVLNDWPADGSDMDVTLPMMLENPKLKPETVGSVRLALGLGCGDAVYLTAPNAVAEQDGLLWLSADPSVATVEDGLVQAVGSGRTTVSVSAGGRAYAWELEVLDELHGLRLPAGLRSVGDEAFRDNDSAAFILLPDSVAFIGERAFAEQDALLLVVIPAMTTEFAENVFADSENVQVLGYDGSDAQAYCAANGIAFQCLPGVEEAAPAD